MANYKVTECDWCGARSHDSADDRWPKHMERITFDLTGSPYGASKGGYDICGDCAKRASTALSQMQAVPPKAPSDAR